MERRRTRGTPAPGGGLPTADGHARGRALQQAAKAVEFGLVAPAGAMRQVRLLESSIGEQVARARSECAGRVTSLTWIRCPDDKLIPVPTRRTRTDSTSSGSNWTRSAGRPSRRRFSSMYMATPSQPRLSIAEPSPLQPVGDRSSLGVGEPRTVFEVWVDEVANLVGVPRVRMGGSRAERWLRRATSRLASAEARRRGHSDVSAAVGRSHPRTNHGQEGSGRIK